VVSAEMLENNRRARVAAQPNNDGSVSTIR
jgi:hypothetical protein